MVLIKNTCLFLLFSLLNFSLFSQGVQYNFQQNKPSTNWIYSLDSSKHFQIISPISSKNVQNYIRTTINNDLLKIQDNHPIISRNWNLVFQRDFNKSNGFVTYFNPRIEFYGFYPQDPSLIGTNNWLSTLIDHELRHVYQYENSLKYSFPLIKILAGPAITTAWAGLVIPPWVWEGDAIHKESELNPLGRSDNPGAFNPLIAYMHEYGVPSYSKSIGQSYKNYVPNHYVFGQTIVDSLAKNYGEDFLTNTWIESVKKGIFPFSFSHYIKKGTGQSIDKSAENIFRRTYDSNIRTEIDSEDQVKTKSKDIYLNYHSPISLNGEDFIAIRTSFDKIPALVKIEKGEEKILRNFGPRSEDYNLSMGDSLIIFTEIQPDIRFGKVFYSKIYLFDLKTNELSLWNKFNRIQSVAISPSGNEIAYVEILDDGSPELRIKDRISRKSLYSFKFNFDEQISSLQINENKVAFVLSNESGKTIRLINYYEDSNPQDIHFGNQNIGYLSFNNQQIYYSKNINRIDQIFVYDVETKKEAQITHSNFGSYYPRMAKNGELWWTNYTADGLKVNKKKLTENFKFQEIVFKPIIQNRTKPKIEENTQIDKPIRSLNKLYSWGYLTPSDINDIGIGIEMANSLSNWQLRTGLNYNYTEQNFSKSIDFAYHKFLPIIHFSFVNKQRSTSFYSPNDEMNLTDQWNENKLISYINFPLNLTNSSFATNLDFNIGYSHTITDSYDLKYRTIRLLPNGNFGSLFQTISFQSFKNRSLLDLGSRLGIFYRLDYVKSLPNAKNIQGEILVQNLRLNLPGFMKHDFIQLRAGSQNQMVNNYLYNSTLRWPLGISYIAGNKNYSIGGTYSFPIGSVEWQLGKLAYFKRFKGKVFFDKAYVVLDNYPTNNSNLYSYGLDLSSNLHLFRFFQEFELGMRLNYNGYQKEWIVSPLVINIGL